MAYFFNSGFTKAPFIKVIFDSWPYYWKMMKFATRRKKFDNLHYIWSILLALHLVR